MAPKRKYPSAQAIEDHELQYGHGQMTEKEMDEKYPNRPQNFAKTLPFHDLFIDLFNPLNDNKKKPAGPSNAVSRRRNGPHGPNNMSPHEARKNIIEKFVSRWRNEVGDDFYPALRLILPEKDRDRAMYGLKEKAIGKLIVKMLKISQSSDDAQSLLNWKLPGQTTASRMAGDFAGRCYEVLSKRAMRSEVGNMRIAEVNNLLDQLSTVSKEEEQLPIFEKFYNRMNADELLWLIRIILRQMKIGASEKTILELWHPDAEALFNVSSSLRRVCWELTNPNIRLEDEDKGISLMSCFQPQLAQFQSHSFEKMIEKMNLVGENPTFWIEEKLDGERMQLHMTENPAMPGGKEFKFWSRKGKDYTYLYGKGYKDENSSLTRFIEGAFDEGVRNIILDGEMITWDPETDAMVGFGTLKTAAIGQQRNPHEITGERPLFRVFDCLYLNDTNLTRYELRERRGALEKVVKDVHRRLEKHKFREAHTAADIDEDLRKVIAEASEGLVLKNPSSIYRLNTRCDDWMKVKPEYMTEFGESLDCVVIGGYYGSGHRGGRLSSFLCGLRVGKNHIDEGADPMKCYSFFKVGGGFRAEDYAQIKHITDGKWHKWDPQHPPTHLIRLGGQERGLFYERPDEWIRPCDSVVLEVKAASVGGSEQFGLGLTLRFPRFKKLKRDKDWEQALSIDGFMLLKEKAEEESKEKKFEVASKRRVTKRVKKELVIVGNDSKIKTPYAGPSTKVFGGLTFCVLSEMVDPIKKSKAEIEQIIKTNGGAITQSPTAKENTIIIGDKKVVKVAGMIKRGEVSVIKPKWVLDAVKQAEIDGEDKPRFLIPFEEGHMFFCTEGDKEGCAEAADVYGDPYFRDLEMGELKRVMDDMFVAKYTGFDAKSFLGELEERGHGLGEVKGSVFKGCVGRFVPDEALDGEGEGVLKIEFLFGGGRVAESDDDPAITHFLLLDGGREVLRGVRETLSKRGGRVPRVVGRVWLRGCWEEGTLLDEERFVL